MEIKLWTAKVLYDSEWWELGYFTSEEAVQASLDNLRALKVERDHPLYYEQRVFEGAKPKQITIVAKDEPLYGQGG